MAHAVRPGGRVILSDDDYDGLRLWPEPPGFSTIWTYQRTYDGHGNNPIIGRRFVQLLHRAGLLPGRNELVFFGGCAGDPDFEDVVVRNIASIVDEATDDILATRLARNALTATP